MTETIPVRIMVLPHAHGLTPLSRQSDGAAGMDMVAAIEKDLILPPGGRVLVPCGFAMALPEGFEAQVRPRSGLAAKFGVTVLNSPGTIDADYRGEVKVVLINHGEESFVVRRGERIAQMVVAPVTIARLQMEVSLDETERGSGGFGSTGRL